MSPRKRRTNRVKFPKLPKPKTYEGWLRLKHTLEVLKELRRNMWEKVKFYNHVNAKLHRLLASLYSKPRIRYNGRRLPSQIYLGEAVSYNTNGTVAGRTKYNYNSNFAWEWRTRMYDTVHHGPPYKCGGPLLIVKYSYPRPVVNVKVHKGHLGTRQEYTGGFMPNHNYASFDSVLANRDSIVETGTGVGADRGDIWQYGATGYNKYKPGNPTAQLGVFLLELEEVPRMLASAAEGFHHSWRAAGGDFAGFTPTNISDQWLSANFGWKPFLGDLSRFMKTYRNLNKSLDQIRRDNGQWVKRGGVVAKVHQQINVVNNTTNSGMSPTLPTWYYNSAVRDGTFTVTTEMWKRVWFEGRFKYWIPETDTQRFKYSTYARLMGLTPTPSMVWELIPFSWLVDWSSNVGDLISNFDTGWASNLVSKYAYNMGATRYETRVDVFHDLYSGPSHYQFTAFQSWKKREGASPFGFGSSTESFTSRQWSILAALGVQRQS